MSDANVDRSKENGDIHTDTALVYRFLCTMKLAKRGGEYRWHVVAEWFGVGSTSANQICKRHGFNPDERVKAL